MGKFILPHGQQMIAGLPVGRLTALENRPTGGNPGGSDTQLQFNNAGTFGGMTSSYNNSTGAIVLGEPTASFNAYLTGSGFFDAQTNVNALNKTNFGAASFIAQSNVSASDRVYGAFFIGQNTDNTPHASDGFAAGGYSEGSYGGSGTIPRVEGHSFQVTKIGAGTITNAISAYIPGLYRNDGTVTNNFGLKIDKQTLGTTRNYNLYSGTDTADLKSNIFTDGTLAFQNYFAKKDTGVKDGSPVGIYLETNASTGNSAGQTIIADATFATGTMPIYTGALYYVSHTGAGTTTELDGFETQLSVSAGVVTNANGIKIDSPSITGGTVTNVHGIKIDDQTGATTGNWNIYAGPSTGLNANASAYNADAKNVFYRKDSTAAAPIGLLSVIEAANNFGTGIWGVAAAMTGNTQGVIGFSSHGISLSTGTVGDVIGNNVSAANNGSGTITRAYGLNIESLTNTGGGSVGTFYGIYVADQTVAGTDYAIYTNAGLVRFGDAVSAVGAITASNLSGTNTGDQTITLTGGVTGSGTGSFAATVITNANLTGPITSVGNATSIASQTGTGSTFVMSATPTIATPVFTTSAETPLLIGSTAANGDISINGTSNATKTTSYVTMQETGGLVGIGTATPLFKLDVRPDANSQMAADVTGAILLRRASDNAFPGDFMFAKARGTITSPSTIVNGDDVGTFSFRAYANSVWTNQAASFGATIDGTVSSASTPGRLYFNTTPVGATSAVERMRIVPNGNIGIGITTSANITARLHLPAGTATASTAPLKFNSGTILTAAEAGVHEYNGNHRFTNATIRFGVGGTLFDSFADVSVGGAEADIYTATTAANTLNANGDKIFATYGGNFVTGGTESTQLKVYFANTAIWDSTAVAVATGTTSWRVRVEIIRKTSTSVVYTVSLNTTGASGYVYCTSGELTGLTLSGTNIIKITGTSTGVGSGAGDIVGKMGAVEFKPAA